MGDSGVGDVGFIRRIIKNDSSGIQSIVYPTFELFPGGNRTGWIIWKAKIDKVDPLAWDMGVSARFSTLRSARSSWPFTDRTPLWGIL